MPRKKVNWELEWFKIHNPPEQFYFKFGNTVLISNNLFQTPTVTTNRIISQYISKGRTVWGRTGVEQAPYRFIITLDCVDI